jgi:FlgD Ig-like domain
MVRNLALCIIVIAIVVSHSIAIESDHNAYQLANPDGVTDTVSSPQTRFTRDVPDTVSFGGDDGNGVAFEGGIWDFDTIVSDPFQGFTSVDLTTNPGDYFARVDGNSFTGDPCSPMLNGATGQLWVGIHEDEADMRDFVGGMGYQNNMCQNAYSPMLPLGDELISISFTYFNDTEVDYDFTYIYLACYDVSGEPLEMEENEYLVESLTGIIGEPDSPVLFTTSVSPGLLPSETTQVTLLLRMESDNGYSDEDGDWDTPCGPFACTDISFSTGDGNSEFYDFDSDAEGWTFSRCPGIGAYMGIVEESTYTNWLEELGLICDCPIYGNALEMVDQDNSPFAPPGHPVGHHEQIQSGIVPRSGYEPPTYNVTLVDYAAFMFMTVDRGTFYRPGYRYYPITTEMNPLPHWSARSGQNTHWYAGAEANCGDHQYNLTTVNGQAGDPLPADWDSLMFTFDIYCSAAAFGLDPTPDEGNTLGAPVLDDVSISLAHSPNAPPLSFDANGLHFMDGFGQQFPTYLEPSDRGNANVVADLSPWGDDSENDWLADTTAVTGPSVNPSDPLTQYDVAICFRVTHKGPRQDMVPEYLAWKARLTSDPELDYVCVQMDSVETGIGPQAHRYVSYFHESEPGFDAGAGDLAEANEILPDGVFTPGTGIQYYFTGTWANIPDGDVTEYGTWEFEILPRMRQSQDTDYGVVWPSFLYIDAFNRGAEYYIMPSLAQLGIEVDRYDYLDASASWCASMKRSFCTIGPYNPGGYGNNGCTIEQLLGYRMILLNTGSFAVGSMHANDWELLSGWLNATECELPSIRRGIIFDGDQIGQILAQNEHQPDGDALLNQQLGATLVAANYLDYVDDWEFCVHLNGIDAAFNPLDDNTTIYGNGCPSTFPYNVLGVQGGVNGAQGNLVFYNSLVGETEFAQIVRSNVSYPYNWRSIINGFSLHHLSRVGCNGETCSSDSSCVVLAAADILMPSINWILDGSDPFDPWIYPCTDSAIDEDPVTHSELRINHLRGATPNPFRGTATIRFNLAEPGTVEFAIYDVSGRLVKTLAENRFDAGEGTTTWDGTSNSGTQVGGGIYWMQMQTADGFTSGKKLIVLR